MLKGIVIDYFSHALVESTMALLQNSLAWCRTWVSYNWQHCDKWCADLNNFLHFLHCEAFEIVTSRSWSTCRTGEVQFFDLEILASAIDNLRQNPTSLASLQQPAAVNGFASVLPSGRQPSLPGPSTSLNANHYTTGAALLSQNNTSIVENWFWSHLGYRKYFETNFVRNMLMKS